MRKEVENVLFYIAVSKGGQATISKRLVEEIENAFKGNEDMCLKRKSLKEKAAYKITLVSAKFPDEVYQNIIGYFNQRMGKTLSWKTKETQRLINARFAEGYGVEDFKKVIDNKILSWQSDKKMCKYLRPSTLFGNHFDEYLNEIQADTSEIGGKASYDIYQIKADAMVNTEIKGL